MREWREAPPDRPPLELAELIEDWPAATAVVCASALCGGPLVLFAEACWRTVAQHTLGVREETGGLLLGRAGIHKGESAAGIRHGPLVVVVEALPSEDCSGTEVSLAMGADVWNAARARLASGLGVVGWYHSHPGLGAFFSETDRRTQASFFREAYSLGFVMDPVRRDVASFLGPLSRPVDAGRLVRVADVDPLVRSRAWVEAASPARA